MARGWMHQSGSERRKRMEKRESLLITGLQICAIALFCSSTLAAAAMEDGIRCLRGVKSSLLDPQNRLSSWDVSNKNKSVASICRFEGAGCWDEKENRLISLRLKGMGLSGQISDSLQFCKSINYFCLSDNKFAGPVPIGICDWLPYLVELDLSGNQFSGPIPPELSKCKFLNTLNLDDNSLSGNIPDGLSSLARLKKLSVANNQLTGGIPSSLSRFDAAGFEGNHLCGRPLRSQCGGLRKSSSIIIIIAAGIFGALVSLLLSLAVWWWCFIRARGGRYSI